MAQLRDAQTSELIADGSPEEIARIAQGFDPEDVLFDDIGAVKPDGRSVFDPTAVRKSQDDDIAGLEAEVAKPNGGNGKEELRAAVKRRKDARAAAVAKQTEAQERMQAARDRVRQRGGR